MKVLGLVEQDLDIVSKEYVDNKIKEVSKTDDVAPEGYVKVDLFSLWAVYGLNYGIHKRDDDDLGFSKLLQKCITKEKTHLISPDIDVKKHPINYTELLNIIKSNPICYIKEADYLYDVYGYFENARPNGNFKLSTLVLILWAALKGKGEGHTKKEQIYEYIFELLQNCMAGDGKTSFRDFKDYSGEPLPQDEAGLFNLIMSNPDIYADPMYLRDGVDHVIDAILSSSSGGTETPHKEGYVRLDVPTLLMALPPASASVYKAAGLNYFGLLEMFLSQSIDEDGKGVLAKYNMLNLTQEKLDEIIEKDSVVYTPKDQFNGALSMLGEINSIVVGDSAIDGYVKVNIPTLYMIYSLIKRNLPKNAHLDVTPDDEVLRTLSLCVDRNMEKINTDGKTMLELANTVREAYIPKSQFDELITTAITENFTPIGKKKGYELMKTHYAIYLCSLAHRVKNSRLGQNQQFFKLIKDGYSINEYDERKTLVNDLGFTYDESAPESSYDIDALSNFTNKHPEIYVPTEFTDYVKGTAESTMELFGAVTNLTAFYEDHKNDPKIKIVTPNEYKINRKNPDILYIVKES